MVLISAKEFATTKYEHEARSFGGRHDWEETSGVPAAFCFGIY